MNITNGCNMELMSRYEDNHFDLAIVDPPYGIGMAKQIDLGNSNKKEKHKTKKRNIKGILKIVKEANKSVKKI